MRYLLDTNVLTHLIKRNPAVWAHLNSVPQGNLFISAVTLAEISFGFAKNPEAVKRQAAFRALLAFIPVLPFDHAAAKHYGAFKAKMQQQGKNLAELDLMIAAHADSLNMVLVSNDQAFFQINGLQVQDWTKSG